MTDDQDNLFAHGEDLGPDAPLVYVAMPLSHLNTSEERQLVHALAHIVNRAIQDETRDAEDDWPVRVHSPIIWSAPWNNDSHTPEEIYRLNTGYLWEDADALIVLGVKGASLGAGQELAWACELNRPILYVCPEDTKISRQLLGAQSEHDITVETYESPEGLRDIVGRWLASRRHSISDGPRRRRSQALRFAMLTNAFRIKWNLLSVKEKAHVVATTRIAPARIGRMFSSSLVLAAASASELAALGGALGVDAVGALMPRSLPDLQPQQRAALVNAAAELGWDARTALELEDEARLELARGGTRRLPFASIEDWATFRARRHDR